MEKEMNPSRDAENYLFYHLHIDYLGVQFVEIVELYIMIHTCICMLYVISILIKYSKKSKNKIRPPKNLSSCLLCLNKYLHTAILEDCTGWLQINSDLHYLWIFKLWLNWLRPQFQIKLMPNARQWYIFLMWFEAFMVYIQFELWWQFWGYYQSLGLC